MGSGKGKKTEKRILPERSSQRVGSGECTISSAQETKPQSNEEREGLKGREKPEEREGSSIRGES